MNSSSSAFLLRYFCDAVSKKNFLTSVYRLSCIVINPFLVFFQDSERIIIDGKILCEYALIFAFRQETFLHYFLNTCFNRLEGAQNRVLFRIGLEVFLVTFLSEFVEWLIKVLLGTQGTTLTFKTFHKSNYNI